MSSWVLASGFNRLITTMSIWCGTAPPCQRRKTHHPPRRSNLLKKNCIKTSDFWTRWHRWPLTFWIMLTACICQILSLKTKPQIRSCWWALKAKLGFGSCTNRPGSLKTICCRRTRIPGTRTLKGVGLREWIRVKTSWFDRRRSLFWTLRISTWAAIRTSGQ